MGRVREGRNSWAAHTHKQRGNGAVLLWNLSAFLLHSARIKIFSGLYNFPDTQTNPRGHNSLYTLHMDAPTSSMP